MPLAPEAVTRAEFLHRGQRYAVVFERTMDRAAAGRYTFSIRELRGDEETACIVGDYTARRGCHNPLHWCQPPADLDGLLISAGTLFHSAEKTLRYRGRECCSNGTCPRCLTVQEAARATIEAVRRRSRLFDRVSDQGDYQRARRRTAFER